MKLAIRAFVAAVGLATSAALAQTAATPTGGVGSGNALGIAKEQVERQQTQPGNNAPVWRQVRSGMVSYTNLPRNEAGVLIETGGEDWRRLRPGIATAGGGIIAVALVLLMAFYMVRGPIEVVRKPTGRYIRRFSTSERIAHWSVALSFVVLALTGLVLTFGKYFLIPVLGYTLFSWLATITKYLHNFVGPIFAVVLPIFIAMYVRDNLPSGSDVKWIRELGGLRSPEGKFAPSDKFNAGEKVYFWLMVCIISVVLAVTGLIMDFPNFEQSRSLLRLVSTIHAIAALLGVAMVSFHIYLGTIGNKGAFAAMRYGYVDEAWAMEHSDVWYEEVKAGKAREKFAEQGGDEVPVQVRTAPLNR